MNARTFTWPLTVAIALSLLGCLGGGNSGSETTNGLTGVVKDLEGSPVRGARVALLPEDYNPSPSDSSGDSLMTITDAKGVYLFPEVASGRYNLELSDSASKTLTLLQNIIILADTGRATRNGTLGHPGALDIRIVDYMGRGEKGYVYIPGSTVLLRVDSTTRALGIAHLEAVPVGEFERILLVIELGSDRKIITLAENFEVQSESIANFTSFQNWKFSRKIMVNTVAAGVNENVTEFPLLVRLDAKNFNFSEAQTDGRDLRFAKANGTPMSFKIERWDVLAKRAEIWARMDTVQGKSADQYLNMYWGRPLASGDLPGAGVFEPSKGFASVFHFDETATDEVDGYKDATSNANHLTSNPTNRDAQVMGVIAGAKSFFGRSGTTNGTLSGAVPKGLGDNSSFTVTFWMRFEATPTRSSIMDFGIVTTLGDFHFLIRSDTSAQFGGMDRDLSSGTDPATWQNVFSLAPFIGQWIHVATIYDSAKGTVTTYINGKKMQTTATPPLKIEASAGLRIGKTLPTNPSDTPFNGDLDEVRFYTTILSADHIKLDFETQKP
jgi:hypothetical protein